ncbi:CaaX prenyl proteinase Rce1 [Cordyceps fumosorosea ARSEF 2679]|uniref:intramembrane prenyl-peptidase Rce1 n=1 Tax=Cordyceps fumosorosea (strain ARSEF 2679) TaxID=1081104 RepID=A0A167MIE0_CORFA|nr:CaaX prenyl proteinase Rce1 [Cordyceps fumosorosea ARSEF 2679]OAA54396.1 CaaX prenyl proteinase Rce1 [Cordyceps fumosorosea ARSEF 2679]
METTAASPAAELTTLQASALMLAYSVIYVLPLYASDATRPSPSRSRDDLAAIRARVRAVTLSTVACSVVTLITIYRLDQQHAALYLMGYWPVRLSESAKATLLTAILFAGPLYESLLIDGGWRHLGSGLQHLWRSWPEWRNIVAGPVTEECLFRSAVVPLLVLAKASPVHTIFLSPLVFGVAHMHHFYEFRLTNPEVPIWVALLRTVIQLAYTSVFGAYVTFLFLRTGSLLAVVLVHAFCNSLGLPRVWGYMEPYWLPTNTSRDSPFGLL